MPMPTEFYIHEDTGPDGIEDGESLVIDISGPGHSSTILKQYSGDAAAELYYEQDPDGDGTYEVSILMDSFTGPFHSEGNRTPLTERAHSRVRVKNVSGGAGNFTVSGIGSAGELV